MPSHDGKRLAEIAVALELRGHGARPSRPWIEVSSVVKRDKEKRLLLPAIDLRDPHWPAECTSELVEVHGRPSSAYEVVLE